MADAGRLGTASTQQMVTTANSGHLLRVFGIGQLISRENNSSSTNS
jgi:hypothetical protein